MTKIKLREYIQKDIQRLEREQYKLGQSKSKTSHELKIYVISRKHTLKEVLNLLPR